MTTTMPDTASFQDLVNAGGNRDAARAAASALRGGDHEARLQVAALALYGACVAPELLPSIYDGFCEGWYGKGPSTEAILGHSSGGVVPNHLWAEIWAIVLDPHAGDNPATITARTAALTGLLPLSFHDRVAAMSHAYPGVDAASQQGMPPKFQLDDLAACPRDSLGGLLYGLVIDKGFDLEVLDRDGIGLEQLPAPLPYLNVRILQCHDIWHFMGGYETTSLHEVAISGFQMGQFGHQYSSMFLGVVIAQVAFIAPPEAIPFLLDTIFSAYIHGRETPALLPIEWESLWMLPLNKIRETLGVRAYDSPYPANIIEDLQAAS